MQFSNNIRENKKNNTTDLNDDKKKFSSDSGQYEEGHDQE